MVVVAPLLADYHVLVVKYKKEVLALEVEKAVK